VLTPADRELERVMLGTRIAEGLPLHTLPSRGQDAAAEALRSGLLSADAYASGRAVLTLRGRLLADAVVRLLLS
jgi:hypothetical protein